MRGRGDRIVLVDRRSPAPAPEKDRKRGLETAATVGAGALGLVGYLYALGGIVVWLRVQTSQLTPDGAIIGADDRHLLAVGARVVGFELLLALAIAIVIGALLSFALIYRGERKQRGRKAPRDTEWKAVTLPEAWKATNILASVVGFEAGLVLIAFAISVDGHASLRWVLGAAGAALALLVAGGLILLRETEDGTLLTGRPQAALARIESLGLRRLRGAIGLLALVAVGTALALVPLLQGTILLGGTILIYLGHLLRWPGRDATGPFPVKLVRSSGAWLAVGVLTAIALAWVATPPVGFTRVVVNPGGATASDEGAYVDRGDGGLYLGLCTAASEDGHAVSTDAHIEVVPAAESEHLSLGGRRYSFDPGGRPSLGQVLIAMVGGGNAATEDAPLDFPLHGRQDDLCGG